MKKLIPLIILVTEAATGFSQGIVQFQNHTVFNTPDPTGGNRLVYGVGSPLNPSTGVGLEGTNYVVELYVGPANSAESSLTPIVSTISPFYPPNSAESGRWPSRLNNFAVNLGVAVGTPVTLAVHAWDYALFPTYEAAVAGGGVYGTSGPFQFTAADKAGAPYLWLMEGFHAFALVSGVPPGCPRPAQATAQLSGGSVAGITVTDGGCGYANPPAVLIQCGGGTGATATAVIIGGRVTAINITSAGCCYTNTPTIIIGSPVAPTSPGIVLFENSAVFQTGDPTGGNRLVYDVGSPLDPHSGVPLVGTNYVAELYSATGSGATECSLTPIASTISRFRGTTTVNTGKWTAGPNDLVYLRVNVGTVVTLQARVWDISLFPTYEAALAGGGVTGKSVTFDFTAADPASDPRTFTMEGLQAFALGGCPRHKAQATAQLSGGSVTGVIVTDGGCGYTNPPVVLIQGGGGTGATATALVVDGQVTAINITSAGCCYTNAPTIIIGSPWFAPSISIGVSRVKLTEHVVLGRTYVLQASIDGMTWTDLAAPFTAQSETIQNEFDVGAAGGFFRLREAP